ncbi:flavin monoamine oxidase family protein [Mycobacterium stomatepiae]|uniref:Putative putrescine oxidase n=1 Tax=Mycobacterium stomatepiae TaxID=470076 RepID=A0A7I7Q4B0_9MYCO|nr:NAD(P)/FAD-dependent oxidoreductase [Mycobacterium stomatepiae]MCV7163607.1 FAD-dependent oxidoreductase [Mycobacterium stomatepiae]BBY21138.1 putative putrescine oxidase [Mycobacterium stomatepiae]
MPYDVAVLGAGLSGLSAARDLMRAGADIVVLEARNRVGGRVEQVTLDDGRIVQLGGEVIGNGHTAYHELVAELGLTLIPSYVAEPGELTYILHDDVCIGDEPSWFSDEDRRSMDDVKHEFATLAATVDADDPWSHPNAVALDTTPVMSWLGGIGATPNVRRALEAGQLGLSSGSFERTSLLALLRKAASMPSKELYSYDDWENLRVAEGSATVALRMAAELGDRIRLNSPVRAIKVAPGSSTVQLISGELVQANAVVSSLPAGPLRDIKVEGVSDARLESLHRQRHALAAKFVAAYTRPFWRDRGQNGLTESEGILGSSWPQTEGVLSCLVPPERIAAYLSSSTRYRQEEALAELASWFGAQALSPVATFERLWGTDPWTQGYVTQWRPGDVHRVGPLHGTHEPPFYVCGSDQWVAGYMEGAVRTGRAAAAEALVHG